MSELNSQTPDPTDSDSQPVRSRPNDAADAPEPGNEAEGYVGAGEAASDDKPAEDGKRPARRRRTRGGRSRRSRSTKAAAAESAAEVPAEESAPQEAAGEPMVPVAPDAPAPLLDESPAIEPMVAEPSPAVEDLAVERRRGAAEPADAVAPSPVAAAATQNAAAPLEPLEETVAGIISDTVGEVPIEEEEEPAPRKGRRRRRGGRRRRRGRQQAEGQAASAEEVQVAEPTEAAAQEEAEVREVEAEEEEEEEEVAAKPGKIMLVNIAESDECRIAMLEDNRLQEFYVERTAALSHVGNIYKGVVTNTEPSIQAAFIDFGQGKNGFLHVSDLQPQYFPGGGASEDVGRKTPRRDRPPIQKCLRRGQEIIVQVTKEGIGTKGATLTTYCALPGRYLVMMPGMSRLGVSRKIEDEDARRRMRDVLNQLELPKDMGFILRTAGLDRNKRELQRDLNYLVRLWRQIIKRKNSIKAPAELYRESDLVTRTLRDVVTTDVQEVLIDSEPVAQSARQFLRLLSPRLSERVRYYQDSEPLFFRYGVEDEITKIYSKRVPLSSGGSLVIESTEALVAIDVNSGKFREAPDPEESAFRINLEAAEEIARQLSLRDLGGVIICDFIDMHMERHRREIERALRDALKKHKERAEILRMSRFGIIEMTRQRQRPSILRSMLVDCPHCNATGMIKSSETIMLEALRAIQTAATHTEAARIEVRLEAQVAQQLLNSKRRILADLESRNDKAIVVLPSTDVSPNKITVTCYDKRGWPVQVPLPKALTGAAGGQ